MKVPDSKATVRSGATDPIGAAILKAGKHLFDLVPGQVQEPMVGNLLSTLQELTKVIGDEGFRENICDQSLQFQVQSSKSSLDSHLHEFPADPSLQKVKKLGGLVMAPENTEGVEEAKIR